jgi:hypothetical protein
MMTGAVRAARTRARRLISAHWLFAAVLAGAVALRAVVMLGYPPAMWFPDSYSYVAAALDHALSTTRPGGYPAFLALLAPLHSFAVVTAVQHLLGLAIGTACYALLRRRGLPGWGAALAAVPVLYDAYQVQVEQQVMADVLFLALVTAAVGVLLWRGRVSALAAAIAGALTALAILVRSAGLPLLVVAAAWLLVRRAGWRPLAALVTAGVVPLAGYMLVFSAQHGNLAMTDSDGVFLYGRVMSFADCRVIRPPPSLARLCDPRPPSQRPVATEYIWRDGNPLSTLGRPLFSPRANRQARAFAVRAIEAQPLPYLRAVAADLGRSAGWARTLSYDYRTDHLYLFSTPPPTVQIASFLPLLRRYQPGLPPPRAVAPFAGFARAYQRYFYLRGTLLALILLAGLARGVRFRRRSSPGGHAAGPGGHSASRGAPPSPRWPQTLPAGHDPGLLPWAFAVVLLVFPLAVAGFDYRYELAVTPFGCLAAALAFARRPPGERRSGDPGELGGQAGGGGPVKQEQGPLPAAGAGGWQLDRADV